MLILAISSPFTKRATYTVALESIIAINNPYQGKYQILYTNNGITCCTVI